MTPADLRSAARALYERHADALGLDPWRDAPWRDAPPTPGQRRALTYAAGAREQALTDDDARTIRAVAIDPDSAGKGAAHDVIAVTAGYRDARKADTRARVAAPPAAHTPRPDGPPSDAGRIELVRAVLDADAWTLMAVRAALGRGGR